MKNLNIFKTNILVLVILFFTSTLLFSQDKPMDMHGKDNKSKSVSYTGIDKNGDGVVYECPMKCEEASDKHGECSKCGMDLKEISVDKTSNDMMKAHSKVMKKEKKADCSENNSSPCCGDKKIENNGADKNTIGTAKTDKNNDGYVYECPMKCEPASDKPGECSKCGMDLKKVSMK